MVLICPDFTELDSLRLERSELRIRPIPGPCASVTKQYNFIPAKGR